MAVRSRVVSHCHGACPDREHHPFDNDDGTEIHKDTAEESDLRQENSESVYGLFEMSASYDSLTEFINYHKPERMRNFVFEIEKL